MACTLAAGSEQNPQPTEQSRGMEAGNHWGEDGWRSCVGDQGGGSDGRGWVQVRTMHLGGRVPRLADGVFGGAV